MWHELYLGKILSNLGRIFKTNFPTSWRKVANSLPTNLVGSSKSHFCPIWSEVKKHFAAICGEVMKATSTQIV